MKSIGVAAVIAAVIFPGIYLTVTVLTGEVGAGSIAIALIGGLGFGAVAGLIGSATLRSRER
jgi:hypothetical protein